MREHYARLSDLEIIRLIETENGLMPEALHICLDIISERNISESKCRRHATLIYKEKLAKFYNARGFYAENALTYFSYFLSEERKKAITLIAFKEMKALYKHFNKGIKGCY